MMINEMDNDGILKKQISILFDEAIPMISKIIFSIGGFFDENTTYTIILNENFKYENKKYGELTKDEFLSRLKDIHIGEWKHNYHAPVMDGISWELTIEYADSQKLEYFGSNAFPDNFDDFCDLIGYDSSVIE